MSIGKQEWLLQASREELGRADQKASLLSAATGIILGPFVVSAIGNDSPIKWFGWVSLVGISLMAASLVAYVLAAYPRTRRTTSSRPDRAAFFSDFNENLDESMAESLNRQEWRQIVVDQLREVSSIVVRKYRLIKVGIWLSSAGISLAVIALFGANLVG